ncbi:MAG: RusA family crossover junction endodeoxyribonuclease [Pseudoclavibacter sp.]
MNALLRFFVAGTPAPQGSKRHVGNGVLVESSPAVKPWREDVRNAAEHAATVGGWNAEDGDQPLACELEFWLRRPASHPKRTRTAPMRKPDIDKLVRSTLDALTSSGVIADDARIVDLIARKRYVHPIPLRTAADITADRPGALITLSPITRY